jgi:hypothetical protein
LDGHGFFIQKYSVEGMRFGWTWIFYPKILLSRDEIRMNMEFSSKYTAFEG